MKAPQVEHLELPFLYGVYRLGFNTIQFSADDAGFVDINFGRNCEVFIFPYSLGEFGESCQFLAYVLAELCIIH